MGNVISEGLEYIGRIDDHGFIFDQSGHCFAQILDSGYITEVAGGKIYGKIDTDGTIRDSSLEVIGRIQADGYVYIHSKRVCKVSSEFIDKITPDAWNPGKYSSFSGRERRKKPDSSVVDSVDWGCLFSPFAIKIYIGLILGIVMMVNGLGPSALLAGPVIVLLFSFFAKIFG